MKTVKAILAAERMNYRRIHLYLWDEKWYAVERSAYYFASLFKTACPAALCHGQGKPILAIGADSGFKLLEKVVANDLSILRVDPGHIAIRLGKPMGGYKRWRTRQTTKWMQGWTTHP